MNTLNIDDCRRLIMEAYSLAGGLQFAKAIIETPQEPQPPGQQPPANGVPSWCICRKCRPVTFRKYVEASASDWVSMTSRNEAYLARTQLAVLDHNSHCDRQVATTTKGEQRYHRKYRKQSKKWDVTPVKTKKEYKYIPELIAAIP